MKVRVFYPNKDGKIEFTKQQLEKLLDEVYEEGRAKGWNEGYDARRPITITYPYTPYWYNDYTTTTTSTPNLTWTAATTNASTLTDNTITLNGGLSIGEE